MWYLSIIVHVIVAALCASTWWKAARMEDNGPAPLIWSAASLALFAISWLVLDLSWLGIIFIQLAMGLAIGIIRAILYLRRTRQ